MQAEYKLTVPPVTEADADTLAAERMRAALVRTGKWAGLKVSSTDPGSVKGPAGGCQTDRQRTVVHR
jgi:hypothetical protein